jgi:hypothetical protein
MGRWGRRIDIPFDVDLGELVDGHRVIARGLELRGLGAVLHYEFVPGIETEEQDRKGHFFWYWTLRATDDRGTKYDDSNTGGFDTRGGPSIQGERDVGGRVPRRAATLRLAFEPPEGWTPPEPWRRAIVVDLVRREVVTDDVVEG